MRFLASLEHYLATTTPEGVQLHHYASGRVRTKVGPKGPLDLSVATDYPFGGTVALRVAAAPSGTCEIALRVPSWSNGVAVTLNGRPIGREPGSDGYFRLGREWAAGDELVVEFAMRPRVVRATDDVDGARGCVAFERGPLVYCLEGRDIEGAGSLRGVSVTGAAPTEEPGLDICGEAMVALKVQGSRPSSASPAWPYFECSRTGSDGGTNGRATGGPREHGEGAEVHVELQAVPYFAWANRGASDMRVWVPEH